MYTCQALVAFIAADPGGNNGTNYQVDSATKKYAIAFVPTQTITLAKVNFRTTGITGSPTCTVRIETNSSGRPSGTLAWANATKTGVAVVSGWQTEIALTATGTLTAGTLYHLVISNDAGTPASNYFNVNDTSQLEGAANNSAPYLLSGEHWPASFDGASWTTRSGVGPIYMLVSNDATPVRLGQPVDGSSIDTMSSTTTYYGVKFTAPATGTISGFNFEHLPNGTPTLTYRVYDSSDTLLASGSAPDGGAVMSGRQHAYVTFGTSVSVTAGQSYRVVLSDSTGTDRLESISAPSSPDYRLIHPVLQIAQWTQGSAGSWTDTSGKLPMAFGIVMDSISTGGGGGGNTYSRGRVVNA